MEKFDKISNKITKYITGNLSAPELEAFSTQLKNDPKLKEEVEFRRFVMEGVKSFSNENLRGNISSSMKEAEKATRQQGEAALEKTPTGKVSSSGRIISFGRRQMAIAASILVLITFGTFWNANQNYSNSFLVSYYHDLPSTSIGLKGDTDNITALNKAVEDAYAAKDYEKAIQLFSSVEPSSEYNTAQYHLGNLYLETQQSAKAIDVFQDLIKTKDVRYQEEVEWLLVLSQLQNGNLEQAKTALNTILQDSKHSFFNKASEMKNKLDSFWRKFIW